MIRRALAASLLVVAAGGAVGQGTIYRCGNEYSRTPCSAGRQIDTSESVRSAAQRDEALRVAASERKLADELERDRHRFESMRPAPAVHLGPSKGGTSTLKTSTPAKAKKKRKDDADDGDFVAVSPKKKG